MSTEAEGEFDGIFVGREGTRPPMSKPPELQATEKFIREVQNALNIDDHYEATQAAAATARPVFDMEGNGPQCSDCSMIWPLCGHHHMSYEFKDENENEKELSGK